MSSRKQYSEGWPKAVHALLPSRVAGMRPTRIVLRRFEFLQVHEL